MWVESIDRKTLKNPELHMMSYYLPRAAALPGRCLLIGLFPVGHFPNLLPFWNPAGPNRETFLATGGTFGVSSGFSSDPVRSSSLSVGVVIVCIFKIEELYRESIFCKQLSKKIESEILIFSEVSPLLYGLAIIIYHICSVTVVRFSPFLSPKNPLREWLQCRRDVVGGVAYESEVKE